MPPTEDFLDALHGISSRLDEDMTEKDVENAFLNENFFTLLGYEGAGYDLRSEWTLPDNKRPDYVTLDENESVTAVYEFKTSGLSISTEEENQLFHYVDQLKADYGVLTNGNDFRVYRRENHSRFTTISLGEATASDAADLRAALRKPEWDITDPESVDEFLGQLDPVELEGELGQEHFFDTFRLEEDSPFANLVTAMMDLLTELRDEQEAKFVAGAYDFWEASYASEPDETPESWEPFIDGGQSLRDFMFCLESGHALLARLLLAKATDDHDFFPSEKGLRRYFDELGGFSGTIDLDAYPIAANGMIEDMRSQLVQSLFEDDIFIWWTDGYGEQTASQHDSPYSRFESVAKEGSDVTRVSPATRERFSRAIAQVSFAVLKFDFSRIEGDPLGDLYQRYFDPETRKALGEFYTPQPVIDYIMDGVDYNVGVSEERLIDPSCGSGTFLVEAVNRYLEDVRRYNDDPDWSEHLTELCTTPYIVGLDIHPFAVLMAQIRFMVAILPEYREAKREDGDFTIRRLPIFRTDSLRNERELTGIGLGDDGQTQMTLDSITEDSQDVKIPVPLPIEVDEDEVADADLEDGFLVQRVRMPKYDTAKVNAGVRSFGEYYAALQGVLDVVKFHMHEGWWEYGGGLEEGIHRYTTREYDGVEDFFEPYVNDILATVRYLRKDHGDGRLFKMFEDTVLALVVKNYMEYDYVVGNPPYVNVQNLPASQKGYLSELYTTATGQYDIYCPFYERGIEWLSESGKLGYIAPNQFLVTHYGEPLRRLMRTRCRIEEIFDFRDSRVFKDATNYPAICLLERQDGSDERSGNEVRCIRVKSDVDPETGHALDEQIMEIVEKQRNTLGYSDPFIDVFTYPQEDLSDNIWPLMPPEERQVFQKLENQGTSIGDITEAVFDGPTTGSNSVFVVDVKNAEKVDAGTDLDTVRVEPTGDDREYEIEASLLRPWLQGRDVKRWRPAWSGRHVILPYEIETETGSKQVISNKRLSDEFPLAKDYFDEYADKLRRREGGRWEDSDTYWEFSYPRNLPKFDLPKIVFAEFADESTFLIDEGGEWYFKSAYSVLLSDEYRNKTKEVACQLNSAPLEYYFKHIATVKAGGYYAFRSQYVEPLPCVIDGPQAIASKLVDLIEQIGTVLDLDNKTDRFPEAYLDDYDGQLDYIDYEWQTRRYPVNADIQQKTDGRYAVTAGRSDEITDPLMESGDQEERKIRAKYVHAAVDGRNVKSGEETTIPIPRSDEGVAALLEELETDKQTVAETSIEELEADIDEAVYDLFQLTDEEREIVEKYLEVF